ncbi:MAG TPA: porin [Gemmatimonadaceae bacterium]|nr:porin [Gemmatimonadaceae bacterium]
MFALVVSLGVGRRIAAQDSTASHTLPPFDLHGFVEVYYRSGDPLTKDGYRLRKADLKFSGDLSPHIKWRVTFDAAKTLTVSKTLTEISDTVALSDAAIDQRSRILQDAALTYTVNRALSFDVGQQIVPLSLEGTIATSNVETIERTMFIVERSRAGGLGDIRDIGVSVNGRAFDAVEYHVGTFNETGESGGSTDTNDQKSLMGRAVFHAPKFPQFQIGGSGAVEGGPASQRRERAGGEAQFRNDLVTVRAEVMSARDGPLKRIGWYSLGAVRPTSRIQLVARLDSWDRDRSRDVSVNDAIERQMVVGGSYLIDGSVARLAVNVVRQTFPTVTTVRDGTFLLFAFQGVW